MNEHPLYGKRIAVTRAAEQSAGLLARLKALGAATVVCPAILIIPPEDFNALAGVRLADRHQRQWRARLARPDERAWSALSRAGAHEDWRKRASYRRCAG